MDSQDLTKILPRLMFKDQLSLYRCLWYLKEDTNHILVQNWLDCMNTFGFQDEYRKYVERESKNSWSYFNSKFNANIENQCLTHALYVHLKSEWDTNEKLSNRDWESFFKDYKKIVKNRWSGEYPGDLYKDDQCEKDAKELFDLEYPTKHILYLMSEGPSLSRKFSKYIITRCELLKLRTILVETLQADGFIFEQYWPFHIGRDHLPVNLP